MAVKLIIDGLINDKKRWHGVNWRAAAQVVSRLQARIVKAVKRGDMKTVRGLQRLLMKSLSARVLAVRRVTSNQGSKTAGVDKIKLNTPALKWRTAHQLNQPDYRPKPLKRIYIPKKNGKKRPLGIPTQKDRCEQALELSALDPIAECRADHCSNGFRKRRGVHDAIEACWNALRLKGSPQWILEGDIKGCFDNISHDWMMAHTPVSSKDKLRLWLQCGYMEGKLFNPTVTGTPQGGIISPTLANIALDGFEGKLKPFKRSHKVHISRYADDFIITGTKKEFLENEIKPVTEGFLKERGLSLSEEKTKISHIEDGFDFLGFNIRKYKGKLLTKPSKSSVSAIKEKIREIFKAKRMAKTDELIQKLNPIIRGWGNFYRHSASSQTFGRLAHEIWEMTWKWAKRRHPKKPLKWIKAKYYQSKGDRNWVFRGGKSELFHIAAIPIRRHVKIKGEANPYDPEWKEYFKKRDQEKRKSRIFESRRSILDTRQGGKCRVCQTDLSGSDDSHIHHITPKSKGGSNRMENLALLHETCHKQLHWLDLMKMGLLPDALRCLINA